MAHPLELDVDATKREHQKQNTQQKESGGSARTLMKWLKCSEFDADIPHLLKALRENEKDLEQILNCCRVVIKFANKAVNINLSEEWLKAIEKVLLNIDKSSSYLAKQETIPFTDLYIAKFSCLSVRDNRNEEAKECLKKAIFLSSSPEEEIEASFALAQYYENVSDYNEMKKELDKCQKICLRKPILEDYLAPIWLLLGHYYFFQFNFRNSLENLNKAKNKLESILNKTPNETKESEWTHRRLSDCLHYMGRIYNERYELVKAAEYYIEAQRILEENKRKNRLEKEVVMNAFYHLRLGQVLEICQIRDSAEEHYKKSSKIFNDSVIKSGLVQVNLALANLIKSDYNGQVKSVKSTLERQEKQIKDALEDSLKTGYYRGYLLGLLQLFWLYIRNLKFYKALPLVWEALTSDEFKKSGGYLLLYRYAKKFIFGIFYKIRFLIWLKLHSKKVLYKCPCPIHKNKVNEN